MEKLKPCQCGSEDVKTTNRNFRASAHIKCGACGMQTGYYSTMSHAATAWNYRPTEMDLRIELQAARKVIREGQISQEKSDD